MCGTESIFGIPRAVIGQALRSTNKDVNCLLWGLNDEWLECVRLHEHLAQTAKIVRQRDLHKCAAATIRQCLRNLNRFLYENDITRDALNSLVFWNVDGQAVIQASRIHGDITGLNKNGEKVYFSAYDPRVRELKFELDFSTKP